jgi:nucleoside-diphosphate-sugar epimerase
MKIAVLGSNGFIGSAVSSRLREKHEVVSITRDEYKHFLGSSYDVFVNCNGNSRKFWANNNRKEDFKLSVQSVYESLCDFRFKKYIYVSSMDVYVNNTYGYHKKLAEGIISDATHNCVFLRCSSVIGKGMKKGVVKDIMEEQPVFISPESRIELITNTDIARVVEETISMDIMSQAINAGSTTTTTVNEIATFFDKKIKFSDKLEAHFFDYPVDKRFSFKTALEYLECML